jgi:hypothetical protein
MAVQFAELPGADYKDFDARCAKGLYPSLELAGAGPVIAIIDWDAASSASKRRSSAVGNRRLNLGGRLTVIRPGRLFSSRALSP